MWKASYWMISYEICSKWDMLVNQKKNLISMRWLDENGHLTYFLKK